MAADSLLLRDRDVPLSQQPYSGCCDTIVAKRKELTLAIEALAAVSSLPPNSTAKAPLFAFLHMCERPQRLIPTGPLGLTATRPGQRRTAVRAPGRGDRHPVHHHRDDRAGRLYGVGEDPGLRQSRTERDRRIRAASVSTPPCSSARVYVQERHNARQRQALSPIAVLLGRSVGGC